jgi:hypothetical protein
VLHSYVWMSYSVFHFLLLPLVSGVTHGRARLQTRNRTVEHATGPSGGALDMHIIIFHTLGLVIPETPRCEWRSLLTACVISE